MTCSFGVVTTPQMPSGFGCGFTTASGKAARIEPTSLARARRIFAEMDNHSAVSEDSGEAGLNGFVTSAHVRTNRNLQLRYLHDPAIAQWLRLWLHYCKWQRSAYRSVIVGTCPTYFC
jgi:hypothetical protein